MRLLSLVSRPASVLLSLAALTGSLHANPLGGTVTNGTITIAQGASGMTISQAGPRGIIQWRDFSIGSGEFTRFIHSDSSAATLNRVVGGIPSTIHGTLQANGQVYLINPNGILVGPNGRINTAGFVASTLDVPDAQFMAGGDLRFSGGSMAGVTNLGTITASDGDVTLMARSVTNAGSIHAPKGTATLAAGSDILLKAAGDERVVINSGIAGGGTGAENSGSIHAAQARLKAAGGNVYALAVNNTGVVNATGISTKNGRIILGSDGGEVRNSGRLTARNADGSGGSVKLKSGKGGKTINSGSINTSAAEPKMNGGTVAITGDNVVVASTSEINVSGLNAGTVAIGVSAKVAMQTSASGGIATLALAPDAQAALQTTIEAGSHILANSTGTGNGGRVVAWSEQKSQVGGLIEAKAGELGGDGGLIETSGRTGLNILPGIKVSTSAQKGIAGTWLLDPAGISVDNSTTDTTGFTQNASTNHVKASDILTALGSGNVTIATTAGFPGNNDIVVNADLPMTNLFPGNFLTLNSAGGITINNVVGGITSNVSLIFKAAGGNIAFVGSGSAQVSATATVFLDTHLSSTATITSDTGNAVIGGKLSIASGRQGVGTSALPFNTSVSNLEAFVASNAQTTGGGVFIKNSGKTLHIGGVDPSVNGVQVSDLVGFGGIEISNVGADLLLDSATAERITAPGNIKLSTSNSNDIVIINASPNSVRSHFGGLTLNAGGKLIIGDATHAGINVRGQTGVDVVAGGDVSVSGSLLKAGGFGLNIHSGGDINILSSSGSAAVIGTSGATTASLTTGAGGTFNNNTLPGGGLKTTLADDITSVAGTGANIFIKADKVAITSPVNAGDSNVTITPVTASLAYNIGTKDSAKLSFTAAELGQITANTVKIGSGSGTGALQVSANLSSLPFANMLLFTQGPVSIGSGIDLAAGSLEIRGGTAAGITGGGHLTAAALSLMTSAGPVDLTGVINTSDLAFNSAGTTSLTNANNSIFGIQASSAGNSGLVGLAIVSGANNMTIKGAVTTTGLAFITTKGSLFFDTGGSLSAPGIQIDISSGNFINNSGSANVLSVSGGGRFVVYEKDPFGPHNLGGLAANQDTTDPIRITDANNDPLGGGNVFYFTNVTAPVQQPFTPANTRRLFAVSAPAGNESFAQFKTRIQDYSLEELLALGSDPAIRADNAKSYFLQQSIVYRNTVAGLTAYNANDAAREASEVAAAVTAIQYGSSAVLAQKRAVISSLIFPTVLDMGNPAMRDAFYGGSTFVSNVNLSSFSIEQLGFMTRNELLALLGSAGVKLSAADRKAASSATMTQDQLGSIIKAGNGLDRNQFASLVAAGAGNLTLNQLVAAGAGNVVSNDGNSVVSNDGNSFHVAGPQGGAFIKNALGNTKGGDFTVFELAKLISQDGGTLISQDGGTLIGHDGGSLIGHDGGSLIGHDAGSLLGSVLSLISQDGGTILSARAQLISENGLGLITNDGGTLIGHDAGSLIGHDAGSLIIKP